MAEIEVLLPKMGESVAEATITGWLKSEGDAIEADEALVEIATDKVDSEVPAPEDGVLVKILVNDGDVVQVGQPIAIISTDASASVAPAAPEVKAASTPAPVAAEEVPFTPAATGDIDKRSEDGRFLSPLVRNIAKVEGISQAEIEQIQGTGQNNRITKSDILAYLEKRGNGAAAPVAAQKAAPAPVKAAPAKAAAPAPQNHGGNVELIEMDRMRKLIAKHMVDSVQTSPHVTSFVEADVTNIFKWRAKVKDEFFKKYGEKLTFTPIFIEAIVKTIRDFPMINISIDGDYLVKKNDINVGMAAALPSGNLIVPVIKNADQYNLAGLTKQVNDLANRARTNALKPDEISGGTYTVSNVGTFGNVMGTPIINQPQVAIMALGAIRKMPAVIETPAGDAIAIRNKMFLSHSYDHRVVDGALGGMFVRKVADYLENFDINREI